MSGIEGVDGGESEGVVEDVGTWLAMWREYEDVACLSFFVCGSSLAKMLAEKSGDN